MQIERMTVSIREAALVLGVGSQALYRAVSTGEIRSAKIGGRIMIPRAELDRLVGPIVTAK